MQAAPAAPPDRASVREVAAAPAASVALQVQSLHKRFEGIEAVAGLGFEIQAGEVFGLLGPNGAGKTTTISIVSTLLRPTSGDAKVFGHSVLTDVANVRQLIGVVPQELALYPELTGLENLRFFGRMYGVPKDELERRILRLLELVGLEGRRNDRVVTFSGGMKRRLNLAVSMVHEPKLILLDEPTVGVDPHSRENIFTIVEQLRDAGTAILYTTHYMEEAERLCNRLGIMDEGKIIAMGTLDSLLAETGCSEVVEVHDLPPGVDLSGLQVAGGTCRIETHEGITRLYVNNAVRMLGPLHQALGRYADSVSVEIAPLSLENLFLQLTGKDLRD